jgi:hypothetical protein
MREVTGDEQRNVEGGAACSPDLWEAWSKLVGISAGGSSGDGGGLIHETTHAR